MSLHVTQQKVKFLKSFGAWQQNALRTCWGTRQVGPGSSWSRLVITTPVDYKQNPQSPIKSSAIYRGYINIICDSIDL